jgi:hypothetical protein
MTTPRFIRRLCACRPGSLAGFILGLAGRRPERAQPPSDPDWENDAPMTGLS